MWESLILVQISAGWGISIEYDNTPSFSVSYRDYDRDHGSRLLLFLAIPAPLFQSVFLARTFFLPFVWLAIFLPFRSLHKVSSAPVVLTLAKNPVTQHHIRQVLIDLLNKRSKAKNGYLLNSCLSRALFFDVYGMQRPTHKTSVGVYNDAPYMACPLNIIFIIRGTPRNANSSSVENCVAKLGIIAFPVSVLPKRLRCLCPVSPLSNPGTSSLF